MEARESRIHLAAPVAAPSSTPVKAKAVVVETVLTGASGSKTENIVRSLETAAGAEGKDADAERMKGRLDRAAAKAKVQRKPAVTPAGAAADRADVSVVN